MIDQNDADFPTAPQGELLLFQSVDGQVRLECRFGADTLWLSQAMICELYGKAKATISGHISHIFAEGELMEDSVVRFYRTTARVPPSQDRRPQLSSSSKSSPSESFLFWLILKKIPTTLGGCSRSACTIPFCRRCQFSDRAW